MTDVDMDSYGERTDLADDEPAPREPRGDPDVTVGGHSVWLFDAELSETVPDAYVVTQNPEPLDFRMWVFVGRGREAHLVMRASHKYPPEAAGPERDDCCEVLLEGQSLSADHCPEEVSDLVSSLTEAPVVTPNSTADDDHGGPIDY